MISSLEKRIPAELKTVKKQAGKAILPSPPACRRMRLYRRRAHLLAAQGGMTYTPPSIYEIRRNGNVFPEKFSCWEHEFFEYFAWGKHWGAEGSQSRSGFFDSGSVAASGKSGIKNRIVSEDETVSRKSGSSGKSGDGREAGWFRKSKRRRGNPTGPPPPLQKERCAISRGLAAEGLCCQGATPPRGCAAKGFYRLRGALRRGGNQARYLLPRTRTAPARAATVIRLSHRPMAAPSAVLGLSVASLPVLPPLLALGSAAPQTVHLPSL